MSLRYDDLGDSVRKLIRVTSEIRTPEEEKALHRNVNVKTLASMYDTLERSGDEQIAARASLRAKTILPGSDIAAAKRIQETAAPLTVTSIPGIGSLNEYSASLAAEIAKTRADNAALCDEIESARQEKIDLQHRLSIMGSSPPRGLLEDVNSSSGSETGDRMLNDRENAALREVLHGNSHALSEEGEQQGRALSPREREALQAMDQAFLASPEPVLPSPGPLPQSTPSPLPSPKHPQSRVARAGGGGSASSTTASSQRAAEKGKAASASLINAMIRGSLTRLSLNVICYLNGSSVALPLLRKHIQQASNSYTGPIPLPLPPQRDAPDVTSSPQIIAEYNVEALRIFQEFYGQLYAQTGSAMAASAAVPRAIF